MEKLPEKYIEKLRPVLPKTAKMLEETSADLSRYSDTSKTSECSLTIGGKRFEKIEGKWYRETKIKNPEYDPNTPIVVCVSDADTAKIYLVKMPREVEDFHKKIMKLFKALKIKYRYAWQVEQVDIDFDATKFPKFEMNANGKFKKV